MVKHSDSTKIKSCVEIAVVILARNEASILGETLRHLKQILSPQEQLHVVADHCQDQTALIAYRTGVSLHVRSEGLAGKGPALHWWLNQTHANNSPNQVIVILDADSRIAPDFFTKLRERFHSQEGVFQTRIEPLVLSKSPITLLAALSEIVEQRVFDRIRSKLGWPVRMRGTGMAFRRTILEKYSDSLHTYVEDAELTILLAADNVPMSFIDETYVTDPKPIDNQGAIFQRSRWIKGQFQILRTYPLEILRLVLKGPAGWSIIGSVLFKPKALILPVEVLIAAWICILASRIHGPNFLWFIGAIFCASIFISGLSFLYGLRFVEDKKRTLRSLAFAPLYWILWMKSLGLIPFTRGKWLRSRPSPIPQTIHETGSVRS
jgi:cellulose synthase/poly-beta-1,6-N-acetylglucosamine synthase-like glycosyltransferase